VAWDGNTTVDGEGLLRSSTGGGNRIGVDGIAPNGAEGVAGIEVVVDRVARVDQQTLSDAAAGAGATIQPDIERCGVGAHDLKGTGRVVVWR